MSLLVRAGHPLETLLDMDVLSFNSLATSADRVDAREKLELATISRLSQATNKSFPKVCKARWGHKLKDLMPVKTGDDFLRKFGPNI